VDSVECQERGTHPWLALVASNQETGVVRRVRRHHDTRVEPGLDLSLDNVLVGLGQGWTAVVDQGPPSLVLELDAQWRSGAVAQW
jgi:hypothetical protein